MADEEKQPALKPEDDHEGNSGLSGILNVFAGNPRKLLLAIPVIAVLFVIYLLRSETLEAIKSLGGLLSGFSLNGAEFFSAAFAILGAFTMLLIALSFLPDYDRARLAVMLQMAGYGLGWILGMFFSPTSQYEQQTFFTAKTALIGVASGYLLSKFQTIFDKAVAEGKVLNSQVLGFVLMFFIPLMITTAAVYNVRAYKDLSVKITPQGGDVQTKADNGTNQYSIALGKTAHFVAEARFPTNSAVVWSTDPPDEHGMIDQYSGLYKAPTEMPSDPQVDIVATSLSDKTKVDRLQVKLVKDQALVPPPQSKTSPPADAKSPPSN